MFNCVPGVPHVKMERFAGAYTQTCAFTYVELTLI